MEKVQTGYWGNLTPEQANLLEKFKAIAAEKNEAEWKYNLAQFDDYDYLRFLRARKFDLKKTLEMFTNYIKWRISFDVDHILVSNVTEPVAV